nr:MAG TPA: hypothetical protein [Caudoviricetes sp.]
MYSLGRISMVFKSLYFLLGHMITPFDLMYGSVGYV